jgi:hypothetical protein
MKSAFMTLCIKNLWKKRCRKVGGSINTSHNLVLRRVRNALTLSSNAIIEQHHKNAKNIIFNFLGE